MTLLSCFLIYWSVGVILLVGGNLGNDQAIEYQRRKVAENGVTLFVVMLLVGTILWPLTKLLAIYFHKEIERDVRRTLFDNDRWHRVWNGGSAARRSRGWSCPHCHRYNFIVGRRGDELECGWCSSRWKSTDTEATFERGNACCHMCGRQQTENELYAFEPCTAERTARATCPGCYDLHVRPPS